MKDYKLYLFDADGTLRRCTVEGQPCPNAPGEWGVIPGVIEKLKELKHKQCHIISNQGGVAFGFIDYYVANGMLQDLGRILQSESGSRPWGVHMCPHHPKGTIERFAIECACRKPMPGLLYEVMVVTETAPKDTVFIGDLESDKQSAINAGVDFILAKDFFEWEV